MYEWKMIGIALLSCSTDEVMNKCKVEFFSYLNRVIVVTILILSNLIFSAHGENSDC